MSTAAIAATAVKFVYPIFTGATVYVVTSLHTEKTPAIVFDSGLVPSSLFLGADNAKQRGQSARSDVRLLA
jgi:hypothetical protein